MVTTIDTLSTNNDAITHSAHDVAIYINLKELS